jgi:cyanophycinase
MSRIYYFICILFGTYWLASGQEARGSLFIIGGGDRPPALMISMLTEAHLKPTDHIAILTMSGAEPDTSYAYMVSDLRPHCNNEIAHLHFYKDIPGGKDLSNGKYFNTHDKSALDSLKTARLIFITGGVQTRFMNIVLHTPIYDAIHYAYDHGAMIAGTSAGAAVMSKIMITGDQIRQDTLYSGSVDRIVKGNMEITEGLGMLTSAIIDQHFVVRGRYNRLLTVLNQYSDKVCIGIDEETAILVRGDQARVFGNSQVVVLRNPKGIKVNQENKISMQSASISLYMAGDAFKLR